jgi:hypothetical protein
LKKLLFLCIALILILTVFSACSSPAIYKNESLNFSLEIPSSWEGKYKVVDTDETIAFYQSGTLGKFGEGTGRLFTISRQEGMLSKEESEDTPWPSHFMMHANGYTYIMNMPSDVQAPIWDSGGQKLADEYKNMEKEIEKIRNSIKPLNN